MAKQKSWSDFSTKEKVQAVIGIIVILFLLIMLKGLIFGGPDDAKQNNAQASQQNLSKEEQIKKLASDATTEGDGLGKAVREVRVIPELNNGYSVNVKFFDNTGDRSVIEQTMGNVYLVLYTSGKNIKNVTVAATNEYRNASGDTQEIIVYQSQLTREAADKLNLRADKAVLQTQVIPGAWETQKLHDDLK